MGETPVFYRERDFKDTEIGRIPTDWTVVRLKEVGEVVLGVELPLEYRRMKDLPYLYVKISDMDIRGNEKYIFVTENTINDDIVKELKIKLCPIGTVIFPKTGWSIKLRKVRIMGKPGIFDVNIAGVIPRASIVDNEYLHYYLQGMVNFMRIASGTLIPSIRKADIENILIALPPLEEQKRIVEFLSLLDKEVEIERKIIEKVERIKRGAMRELLTGKVRFKRHGKQ